MYQDTMLQRSRVLGDVGGRRERQKKSRETMVEQGSMETGCQTVVVVVVHKSSAFGWAPQYLSSGYSRPDLQPLLCSSFNALAYANVLFSDRADTWL